MGNLIDKLHLAPGLVASSAVHCPQLSAISGGQDLACLHLVPGCDADLVILNLLFAEVPYWPKSTLLDSSEKAILKPHPWMSRNPGSAVHQMPITECMNSPMLHP